MEIFTYDFMIMAFTAGTIIAIICPLVGNFLVLRRLSQIGDTLSHLALAGVAGSALIGINPTIGTVVFVLASSLGIERLRRAYARYSEISIAAATFGGMALAAILFSLSKGSSMNIMGFLFGSLVSVTRNDIITISVLGFMIVAVVYLLFKELLFITFDEDAAAISGIPVNAINALFTAMIAVTIALSMRVVGALLVSALMVIPAATALRIAKSFKQTIAYSIIFSFSSVFSGIFLSYYLDLSPGGTIIAISLIIMLAVNIIKRR
ncbi:metal ABC transporter permease [Mahella australiensis]|uniref:ABC-3 protein n=1 Tax=Mahella australiensis (strain DSM 15567 / CIP 107919 / 50-1 BON) TaxID=697281 RepID=F4A1R2_MAHA5|nr:metal ABC transporter permease [Mahella australiensis]AEE97112.1 ABC-3 protein [Mahella australiensis 50-1 BON]